MSDEYNELERRIRDLERKFEESKNDRDLLAALNKLLVDLLLTEGGRRHKKLIEMAELLKSRNQGEGGTTE